MCHMTETCDQGVLANDEKSCTTLNMWCITLPHFLRPVFPLNKHSNSFVSVGVFHHFFPLLFFQTRTMTTPTTETGGTGKMIASHQETASPKIRSVRGIFLIGCIAIYRADIILLACGFTPGEEADGHTQQGAAHGFRLLWPEPLWLFAGKGPGGDLVHIGTAPFTCSGEQSVSTFISRVHVQFCASIISLSLP